jgi:single-strand DNA-binding protein
MTDNITLTGLVATPPRHTLTAEGLVITSFRLASTQRRFDRNHNGWVDGETNWYTITAFRQLAQNVNTSVSKGQRIIVTGRLRIRDWVAGEKTGTNIEVDADAVGHDLSWGTSAFVRNISSAPVNVVDPTAGAPMAGAAATDAAATDAAATSTPVDWGTSSLGGGTWASQPPPASSGDDRGGDVDGGDDAGGDDDDADVGGAVDDDDDELEGAGAKASEAVPF